MTTEEFFTTLFGDNTGFLILSTKDDSGALTQNKAFSYPEGLRLAINYIKVRTDEDVYFSPMLYKVPFRRAESVVWTPVVYADTDTFDPDNYLLEPSINVQTSPNKTHSYWVLDQNYTPAQVSELSRIVALTHASKVDGKQAGVDPSGWDLSQLLRVPGTVNTKHDPPYPVEIRDASGLIYDLDDFEEVYTQEGIPDRVIAADSPMPTELPDAADVLRKITLDKNLLAAYAITPRDSEWSERLYNFESMMFRAGFEPEEVLVAAWNSSSNKYKRDGRPMEHLWKDVLKAAADPENKPRTKVDAIAAPPKPKDEGLAFGLKKILFRPGEEEQLTETFVDRFVRWGSHKTDAPEAYHVASGLTIMSCILGEWGQAYPLFGEFNLGLFFVIMGETTKTRKSTARNLMKKFLRMTQVGDYKYIITSDATQEALLDVLADRPYQTSMYDRDEAQQLIADVKGGKSYMAGFLEFLNELYDGNARGKARANKKTEDQPVVFVQYLMGIRSQIQENLELKDFMSGWGPRNIYVRGESKAKTREERRLKQGKPGTGVADIEFVKLVQEAVGYRNFWANKVKDHSNPQIILFEDDAWERLIDFGEELEDYIQGHPREEVLSPCVDRLILNVLKVASLFAMAEQRETGQMVDVLNAIRYATQWIEDLVIVVEGVTESLVQRDLDKLEKFIIDNDGLVTYAKALKWASSSGKNRKEFKDMVETLQEQDTIRVVEDGAGKMSLELAYV